MDFTSILVTDQLARELFSAAARDKLLFLRKPEEGNFGHSGRSISQRALSLVVLFEHLVIHDFSDGVFRLPDLENEGIVKIVPGHKPRTVAPAITTTWKRGNQPRGRPPKGLLRSLSLVQQSRPLIINRLLTVRNEFIASLAHSMGTSQRHVIELVFDYAFAYIQGNKSAMQEHAFNQVLPDDFLDEITKSLFAFSDPVDPINILLLMAIVFAEEIAVIQELSSELRVGVATEHYGEKFRKEPALRAQALDAVEATRRFAILRAAFSEEGRFMPPLYSLKQALSLRKDPYLSAIRKQLEVFHSALAVGDRDAIRDARQEIQKARRRLERRARWDKAMRWLAYMSVPVGTAESLVGSSPIIGISLSVVGATGAAVSQRLEKNNEWVLFGT